MTPEQAANHPSKNVISRALGAEETVEVDLKTIEVADGTCFLLCSDGITRHIADHELRQVMLASDDLSAVCDELKRRCYERGAEDNLTAIIVRVGEPSEAALEARYGARTLSIEYPPPVEAAPRTATSFAGNLDQTEDALNLAPRVVAPPASKPVATSEPVVQNRPINIPEKQSSGGAGRAAARFFVFLLFLAGVGAAFYVGTNYRGALPFGLKRSPEAAPVTQPTPVPEDPLLAFEKARRSVDRAPAEWLNTEVPKELTRQSLLKPLDSIQPPFLYLYGRASLLAGNKEEAGRALQQAVTMAERSPNAENDTIRKDAMLALTALTVTSDKARQVALDSLGPKPPQPAK
jgi:protein phosphatase